MARFSKLVALGKTLNGHWIFNGAIELFKQALEKRLNYYNNLQELAICNDNY